MSDDLIFYTNPMSRGRIVRWMLEEVGAPYRTEIMDYKTTLKGPEYLAINPMGKVPTVVHNGTIVTEGAAICAYLADAFPQAKLAPPVNDARRGDYYRWLFFAAGPFEAAVTNETYKLYPPPEKKGAIGYGSYAEVMNALEAGVKKAPYLAGDFSAADVYVGSQIMFGLVFGTVEKRPAFVDYAKRLGERPAHKRATDIDNALLPKKEG